MYLIYKEREQHTIPAFMEYMGLWVDWTITIIREVFTTKLIVIINIAISVTPRNPNIKISIYYQS